MGSEKRPDPISGFAERVRELSESIGQSELSRRSGVSQEAISTYGLGKRRPSLEHGAALAAAAGVTIDWLATGKFAKTSTEKKKMDGNKIVIKNSTGVTIAGGDVHSHPVARALQRPKRGILKTREWREIILAEIRRYAEERLALTERNLCEIAERVVDRPVVTLEGLGDRELPELYDALLKTRRDALDR